MLERTGTKSLATIEQHVRRGKERTLAATYDAETGRAAVEAERGETATARGELDAARAEAAEFMFSILAYEALEEMGEGGE